MASFTDEFMDGIKRRTEDIFKYFSRRFEEKERKIRSQAEEEKALRDFEFLKKRFPENILTVDVEQEDVKKLDFLLEKYDIKAYDLDQSIPDVATLLYNRKDQYKVSMMMKEISKSKEEALLKMSPEILEEISDSMEQRKERKSEKETYNKEKNKEEIMKPKNNERYEMNMSKDMIEDFKNFTKKENILIDVKSYDSRSKKYEIEFEGGDKEKIIGFLTNYKQKNSRKSLEEISKTAKMEVENKKERERKEDRTR